MRQQEHKRRLLSPFRARGQHEFVEHNLRTVHEIAVLRFPNDEPFGRLHVVAVLESDGGIFRQRAVVNLKRRARLRQRLQWYVTTTVANVVQSSVALTERAALDVFAGETNRRAVFENRRERQIFRRRPIDRRLVDPIERVPAPLPRPFEFSVE